MASAAANAALGTEVLAVQRLFYNITPNPAASVLYVLNVPTTLSISHTLNIVYYFPVNF